jgi:hypothetical protein
MNLSQLYIGKWLEIHGLVIEVSRDPIPPREGDGTIRYGIRLRLKTERKDKRKRVIATWCRARITVAGPRAQIHSRTPHISTSTHRNASRDDIRVSDRSDLLGSRQAALGTDH